MRHKPEAAPNNPEVPMDKAIIELMTKAEIAATSYKSIAKLLTDSNNMFLESDKAWVMRQLKRIIEATDEKLKRSLKNSLLTDLENRKEQFPR